MKKFLVLLLILLLMPMSAQAFGIKKTMATIMGSWNGESINSVIKCWGYPSNEKTMAGKTLYYWDWSYNVGNPLYTNAQAYRNSNTRLRKANVRKANPKMEQREQSGIIVKNSINK